VTCSLSLAANRITSQAGDVTNQEGAATFEFIADRAVLDFVATVADRGTTHLEKLRVPGDVARWVQQSGILHDALQVTDEQLTHTRAVREAIFGLITALIDRGHPLPTDRELVNGVATRPRPVSRLTATGQVRRTGDLDAALAVLAADCIDLFDGRDRNLLSWCADPTCTRPFIDRSRGRRRRWCDMKGCGDRAKAVAYRQRHRTTKVGT